MRRSILLSVVVHCPHFKRTVNASFNDAIGRLVHCSEGGTCRQTQEGTGSSENQPYPVGCPIYPSLAAQA